MNKLHPKSKCFLTNAMKRKLGNVPKKLRFMVFRLLTFIAILEPCRTFWNVLKPCLMF